MKLRWSSRSQQDLVAIGRYIAENDPSAARRWVERIRQRAQLLTDHPQSGRIVPERAKPDLREVLFKNYRIVYWVGEELIDIVTVFEGHRAFPDDAIADEDAL